jgi:hypothetical protein
MKGTVIPGRLYSRDLAGDTERANVKLLSNENMELHFLQ